MKEVVLLAKSTKHLGYCVGGMDVESGELIRFVSSESDGVGLIDKQMVCSNGRIPMVLDRVRVSVVKHTPRDFHQENWLIDPFVRWEHVCTEVKKDLLIRIKLTCKRPIFYTRESKLDSRLVDQIPISQRYSMAITRPSELHLRRTKEAGKEQLRGSFMIDGIHYLNLPVKDPVFVERMKDKPYAVINHPTLFLSLTEKFDPEKNGNFFHYKLIASVI